jgi:hypothetical protein
MRNDVPEGTEHTEIAGQRVQVSCMLGRDMMPGIDLDRRISVVARLEREGGGACESGATINEVWLMAGGKVARRTLEPWSVIIGWTFGTRDGPDWDDRYVDVVAHIRDAQGRDHFLVARNQLVGYCY